MFGVWYIKFKNWQRQRQRRQRRQQRRQRQQQQRQQQQQQQQQRQQQQQQQQQRSRTFVPVVPPGKHKILNFIAVTGGAIGAVIVLIKGIHSTIAKNWRDNWRVAMVNENLYDGWSHLLGLWCGLSEAYVIKKQISGLVSNQQFLWDVIKYGIQEFKKANLSFDVANENITKVHNLVESNFKKSKEAFVAVNKKIKTVISNQEQARVEFAAYQEEFAAYQEKVRLDGIDRATIYEADQTRARLEREEILTMLRQLVPPGDVNIV